MNRITRIGRSLGVSLQSVVCSTNFWIAVALVYGALFAEIAGDVFSAIQTRERVDAMGAAYQFNIALNFGYIIYAAPLACAFAAGGNLINDTEASFDRLRLLKSGKREYSFGMFAGSSIGGGLSLLVGMLFFSATCAILYGTSESIEDMATMDAWMPLISGAGAHWSFMLVSALLAFLFGMVWSGIGLTISIYSPDRYVGYLTPFIICFCTRLALPPSLDPLERLIQQRWEQFTFPKLLIYQGVLYLLAMLWFDRAFERRVVCERG